MPAVEDGEIAEDDVAAVLERDGLVADAAARLCWAAPFPRAAAQAFALDEAGADDAKSGCSRPRSGCCASDCGRSPGKAPTGLGLGGVVAAGGAGHRRAWRGEDGRALLKEERDVTLEVDGVAGIDAGGKDDGSAARVGSCVDGSVDGGSVDGCAIAFRAKAADIEVDGFRSGGDARCGLRLWPRGRRVAGAWLRRRPWSARPSSKSLCENPARAFLQI